MSAPTDLESLGYGRGQLRPAPAQSIRRIDVALGRPTDINSAYRDYNEQMRAYLAYQRYLSNPGAYPWAPLALHPDQSWHCKGMAVDTDDSPRTSTGLAQLWADNGWRFEVASEPWHGQYYTSLDKNYGKPSGGGSTPFPTPDDPQQPAPAEQHKEEDVDVCTLIMRGEGTPEWSLIGATVPTGKRVTTSQATANAWALLYGGAKILATRDEYVKAQAEAAALHASWIAQQKAIHGA